MAHMPLIIRLLYSVCHRPRQHEQVKLNTSEYLAVTIVGYQCWTIEQPDVCLGVCANWK